MSTPFTTDGAVALRNLDAQIDGRSRDPTAPGRVARCELLLLRGRIRGRITDVETALAAAERLVGDEPRRGDAHLAMARCRAALHRFTSALDDLGRAERLGADVSAERAGVLEAVGRCDEALALRRRAAGARPTFESLGALAAGHAALGDVAGASALFRDARNHYRGVSPLPPALLDFQHGHLWLAAGEPGRARAWLGNAVTRLPGFVPAQGHLAECEAALGGTAAAVERLRPLARVEDPEYAAQLARLLDGEPEAADHRARATARYAELVRAHPEAFADHAADFLLWTGTDPAEAVRLAALNVRTRDTPRARALLRRAVAAAPGALLDPEEMTPSPIERHRRGGE